MKNSPDNPGPALDSVGRKALSASVTSQEQLLTFLLNPRSYPHRPRRVRLVQTHASFVFLAAPFVFKVKKSVNFGFLDFTTLEQRRHFCHREVVLNRRLAPKIYLGVLPISTRGGRFTFGAGDQIVEYALKMRQMSEGNFLDQILQRGELVPRHLDRIAIVLRDFYLNQHPTSEIESWGRIARLRLSTGENFRQIKPFVGASGRVDSRSERKRAKVRQPAKAPDLSTLSGPALETIRFYTQQFYQRHARLFASRVRKMWIRDCHGDLHLEHIHLTPRALHIYDCIEFNDRFRYVDVANDVAFLAMDLDYEGRPDLARYFARRMAAQLKDDGMALLMDFYKCYRAFVRGKVESLHSIAHAAPAKERRAAVERARRYFRLALQYATAGSQPLVLVLMGRIASGKSTLAQALGAELGWEVYSSDHLRKRLAGVPLYQRTSAVARARLYSAEMTKKTYDRLFTLAEAQLQKGQSLILDATFGRREHRALLAQRLRRHASAWLVLEAQASNVAVKQRLRARASTPKVVSDARLEDYAKLTGVYDPPDELPATRCVKLQTAGPPDQVLTDALRILARLQVSSPADRREIMAP